MLQAEQARAPVLPRDERAGVRVSPRDEQAGVRVSPQDVQARARAGIPVRGGSVVAQRAVQPDVPEAAAGYERQVAVRASPQAGPERAVPQGDSEAVAECGPRVALLADLEEAAECGPPVVLLAGSEARRERPVAVQFALPAVQEAAAECGQRVVPLADSEAVAECGQRVVRLADSEAHRERPVAEQSALPVVPGAVAECALPVEQLRRAGSEAHHEPRAAAPFAPQAEPQAAVRQGGRVVHPLGPHVRAAARFPGARPLPDCPPALRDAPLQVWEPQPRHAQRVRREAREWPPASRHD